MYISHDTDKESDLLHDRAVLSTGRMPHDKQNRNCLDYNQNLVMCPGRGLTPRRADWLMSAVKWLWHGRRDFYLYYQRQNLLGSEQASASRRDISSVAWEGLDKRRNKYDVW